MGRGRARLLWGGGRKEAAQPMKETDPGLPVITGVMDLTLKTQQDWGGGSDPPSPNLSQASGKLVQLLFIQHLVGHPDCCTELAS